MQGASQHGATERGFFGHPRGLMTLFFTEMWERFSYYGMRAILLLFMTAAVAKGGLGFGADKAGPIYAMYTSLVYLASVPGGWIADNFLGQRRSVLYGGIVIMIGHILLAMHGLTFFYSGLACVVFGTGLLKPNISVIVGQLYSEEDRRRDSGFSIFYMGINLGAFASPLVCGWLAQSDQFKTMLEGWGMDPVNSWHWGFGAAAVGMFFGLLQYLMTSRHLGTAGLYPTPPATPEIASHHKKTLTIGVVGSVVAIAGLLWFDGTATYLDRVNWKSTGSGLAVEGLIEGSETRLDLNDGLPISVGDLDSALGEDAGGALREAVIADEVRSGRAQGELDDLFVRIPVEDLSSELTTVTLEPEALATAADGHSWLRLRSVRWTSAGGALSVTGVAADEAGTAVSLGTYPLDTLPDALAGPLGAFGGNLMSEVVTNAIETGSTSGSLSDQHVKLGGLNSKNIKNGFTVLLFLTVVIFFSKLFLMGNWTRSERARLTTIFVLFCGAAIFWGLFEQAGSTLTLFADRSTSNSIFGWEFPSSWWQSLNAVLIVVLAPVFAWLWLRLGKRDPSYPTKFGIGITFAALGFALLIGGAMLSSDGSLVSPMWLFGVYLLHTIGELCLSPVGLSSMTKLAPARVVSLMMGVWFLAASVGNFIGGSVAGFYEDFELPSLFGIVAASGGVMALVMFVLVLPMRRMMANSEEGESAQ